MLVAGGHKWLNAPFGCGVLYVRREIQAQLRQPSWGYLGLEQPYGGWATYFSTPSISPVRPYEFVADGEAVRAERDVELSGRGGARRLARARERDRCRGGRAAGARPRGAGAQRAGGGRRADRQPPGAGDVVGDHDVHGLGRPAGGRGAAAAAARPAASTRRAATRRASAASASRRTTSTTRATSSGSSPRCGRRCRARTRSPEAAVDVPDDHRAVPDQVGRAAADHDRGGAARGDRARRATTSSTCTRRTS